MKIYYLFQNQSNFFEKFITFLFWKLMIKIIFWLIFIWDFFLYKFKIMIETLEVDFQDDKEK